MCSMADVNKQYNGVFYLYNYMYLFVAYFSAAQKKPCWASGYPTSAS